MKQTEEQFTDYACIKLENAALALWVTRDVGPRIIGLQLTNGDNLLAVLPKATATTPNGNVFQFRGGHRLWHAPEDPERTYALDDTAVTITSLPKGIQTTQAVETLTGIEKQMHINLPNDAAHVVIDHTLINHGAWPVELAPWAITQFKPGGFAILPQSSSDTGLMPNRQLSIWPYTYLNSPCLQWSDRFIFVQAAMQDEKLKLGWPNPNGWLGYWVDDTLFIKRATYQPDAEYYDFGSSSECYCDDRFLELETLGPRTILAPGTAVTHREEWYLYGDVQLEAKETAVINYLSQSGIIDRL